MAIQQFNSQIKLKIFIEEYKFEGQNYKKEKVSLKGKSYTGKKPKNGKFKNMLDYLGTLIISTLGSLIALII